jgi:carbamoyl-phosphate synthase small subunit
VVESARIQPTGLLVRVARVRASHLRSQRTIGEFLADRGVVGIEGVDTRAVTKRIRLSGVMPGTITTNESADSALERVRSLPGYDDVNWVSSVTTGRVFDWNTPTGEARYKVALLDGGVKRNIMRSLEIRGCSVRVFPASTSAEDLLELRPDGIVLSPGPGDPRLLDAMVVEVRKLIGKAPILGICLGHQVAARALGAGTFKLPFGHRGGNHPVKDLVSGKVTITAQNHGYAVDADGLNSAAYVSHLNLNDQTVEGIALRQEPLMTIQYHSEACPGPLDNAYIFDRFVDMMVTISGGVR